tara:strand:+ start:637 stop:1644 length:1008 start_codon:yes stop_codon:yes gene_type:complete
VSLKKVIAGISVGDLHGIGMEVIYKSFYNGDLFQKCIPTVFGPHSLIKQYLTINNFSVDELNFINNLDDIIENKLNIVETEVSNYNIKLGLPSEISALIAYNSLKECCYNLKNKKIDVIVTAPIDKYQIRKSVPDFIGHTEYLEKYFNKKSLMVMLSSVMKVAFVTGHISLNQVSRNITIEKIISRTKSFCECLKSDFKIKNPKIAILGLNPHAGENNMLGSEESEIISPAIKQLQSEEKILADGPIPADSFFIDEKLRKYDGILAMYHDQGLIPFKSLSFSKGVNYTAGIDVVRTSPVHGVAYDIAGKGFADPNSFTESVNYACEIFKSKKRIA